MSAQLTTASVVGNTVMLAMLKHLTRNLRNLTVREVSTLTSIMYAQCKPGRRR